MTTEGPVTTARRRIDAPPHWLAQLLVPQRAPIDVKRSVRAAIGIGTPIALGFALHAVALGIAVSIGSLCGAMAYQPGPYRARARRMVAATCAGTVGYLTGGLVGAHGWFTVVAVVAVAGVSALISVAGNNASLAGLQLLVFTVLGTGQAEAGANPVTGAVCFAVGAAWLLLISLGAWPVRATTQERLLVATVYDRIADTLEVIGTPAAEAARQRLTVALNAAYDALLTARSRAQGWDTVYRKLLYLLTETTPIVEATVALLGTNHRPPHAVAATVRGLGDAIRAESPAAPPQLPDSPSATVRALVAGVGAVAELLATDGKESDRDRARPGLRARLERWADTAGAATTWSFAGRLALCMALAELAPQLLSLQRAYWVPLTVAIVLKPDFGSVFGRAVLRGGGTLVGVALGAAILAISPPGWLLVLFVVVIAALLPIGQVRNYGMFATFVTPLVIIQLDLARAGSWDVVADRLFDTLLGCAIVLVFGYLLWPGSRTPRIGTRLASTVDALHEYLRRVSGDGPRSPLRRRTYRGLADLRTEFQRLIAEPSAAGRQAAAWWPAIVALERTTDAVTRLAVRTDKPAERDVNDLLTGIAELAAAVRDGREPVEPELPEDGPAAGVAAELSGVYAALSGPRLDPQRPFAALRGLLPRARRQVHRKE